jgi:Protein of unknown function (DUF5672)
MKKIQYLDLSNVTLVSVSGIDPEKNLRALEISRVGIHFGDIVLISRLKPKRSVRGVRVETIVNPNWTYDEFSKFMLFDLFKHIDTEFALFVHHRAHVVRPSSWSDDFLKYDYVGAPWAHQTHFTPAGTEVRVGNGGFSLRSQRLMRAPSELGLDFTDNQTGFFHEDGQLCVYHRQRLEEYGIRFAPVDVAARFATETLVNESVRTPFGYHNSRSAVPLLFHPINLMRRIGERDRH